MDESVRPLRLLGSIVALLAGLFAFALTWDIWDAQGDPLARFNPSAFLSWYGLGVVGKLAATVVLGAALLWLFVRLGSSKPLPRIPGVSRAAAQS